MKQIILGIDGMMCGMCEAHVNDCVRNHFKVKKVTSSKAKKQTVILAEEVIPEADLRAAIDPTGYTVTSYAVEDAKKKGLFGF
ncbi:MAG: ATPase P [Solobacterium sp.]|nr:ATPase P [Solobacterium sp.]